MPSRLRRSSSGALVQAVTSSSIGSTGTAPTGPRAAPAGRRGTRRARRVGCGGPGPRRGRPGRSSRGPAGRGRPGTERPLRPGLAGVVDRERRAGPHPSVEPSGRGRAPGRGGRWRRRRRAARPTHDRRGRLGVGADVVAGAEHPEPVTGGEHRVEQLGPLLATRIAVADARAERRRGPRPRQPAGAASSSSPSRHTTRWGTPRWAVSDDTVTAPRAEPGPAAGAATGAPAAARRDRPGRPGWCGAAPSIDGLGAQLLDDALDGPPLPGVGVGDVAQVGEGVGQRRRTTPSTVPEVPQRANRRLEAVEQLGEGARHRDVVALDPGVGGDVAGTEPRTGRSPWPRPRGAGRGPPATCARRGRPAARRPRGRRARDPNARWWPRPTR